MQHCVIRIHTRAAAAAARCQAHPASGPAPTTGFSPAQAPGPASCREGGNQATQATLNIEGGRHQCRQGTRHQAG